MMLVTSNSIVTLTYHNVLIFISTNVSFLLSWSFLLWGFVIWSYFKNFFIMIVIMILDRQLNSLFLTSLSFISLFIFIIISKIILSQQWYCQLLIFVSRLTLFSFLTGCSFAIANRIMGWCRAMWNIAKLIIHIGGFKAFVTLFVWIFIQISTMPWTSLPLPLLKALFLFIGYVEYSICIRKYITAVYSTIFFTLYCNNLFYSPNLIYSSSVSVNCLTNIDNFSLNYPLLMDICFLWPSII